MAHRDPSVTKGLAAGLVGGLAATWVMTKAQQAWSAAQSSQEEPSTSESESSGADDGEDDSQPTTVTVASNVSRALTGRDIPDEKKPVSGQVVHYGFGTLMGGLYGTAAELDRRATAGFGTGFGAALFTSADEAALPALGLSPPPHRVPASTHAYGLMSHLVYGVTAELVRRIVRRAL